MIDFESPIADYESYFKTQHEKLVTETFDELLRQSGVDEEENAKTVAALRELESDHGQGSSSRSKWKFLRIAVIVAVVALPVFAFVQKGLYFLLLLPAIGLVVFLVQRINPEISKLNAILGELSLKMAEKTDEASKQMAPLNALYTWNLAPKLMQKTFPSFVFDRYLSANRLYDLQQNFGLLPEFNDGLSLLASQSGAFNGNPFVLARYKQHWMGDRTYTGFLVIQWVEQVQDDEGDWFDEVQTQTLTASVTKPYPEYQVVSKLIFGHESAPNLTFSREPSKLSASNSGSVNQKKVDRTIKKVERQARKGIKSGNSELTVMSNREFEALFKATDRDNEIEFRLLFTPLAQQEMVELLNDDSVGFGDDFYFAKFGYLNLLESFHLANTKFDDDPQMFQSLELKVARRFFTNFHQEYFRSIYFAFAPLWTIPLYRDSRSAAASSSVPANAPCSDWENEVMANYIGENRFKHPESVTENIVRAYSRSIGSSTSLVDVVGHGYAGVPRVDFIPVLGGDGNLHSVPVEWIEYIPVTQQTTLMVGAVKSSVLNLEDGDDAEMRNVWESSVQGQGINAENVYLRNGIAAAIIG